MKRKSLLFLPFLLVSPLGAQDAETTKKATPQPATPAAPAAPTAETDPATIRTNSSYAFGFNNANAFQQQMSRFGLNSDDIDREQFIKGFSDVLDGNEAAHSQEVLNAAMLGLRNQIQEREKTLGEANLKAAEEFLATNKEREGVTTTESGLQYEILKTTEGETHDGSQSARFIVNYRGTLIDGTEFDASPEGSPATLGLNVVPGFKEALTIMPVGSHWKIFIKPELGYGSTRRSEKLAPNSVLIFDLELVAIQKASPRPKAVSPPIQIPPAPKPTKPKQETAPKAKNEAP